MPTRTHRDTHCISAASWTVVLCLRGQQGISPLLQPSYDWFIFFQNKQMCLYMKGYQYFSRKSWSSLLISWSTLFSLSQRPPACRSEEGAQREQLDFLSHLSWILGNACLASIKGIWEWEGLQLEVDQQMGSVCLNWKLSSPFTYLSKTFSPSDIIHPPKLLNSAHPCLHFLEITKNIPWFSGSCFQRIKGKIPCISIVQDRRTRMFLPPPGWSWPPCMLILSLQFALRWLFIAWLPFAALLTWRPRFSHSDLLKQPAFHSGFSFCKAVHNSPFFNWLFRYRTCCVFTTWAVLFSI